MAKVPERYLRKRAFGRIHEHLRELAASL